MSATQAARGEVNPIRLEWNRRGGLSPPGFTDNSGVGRFHQAWLRKATGTMVDGRGEVNLKREETCPDRSLLLTLAMAGQPPPLVLYHVAAPASNVM